MDGKSQGNLGILFEKQAQRSPGVVVFSVPPPPGAPVVRTRGPGPGSLGVLDHPPSHSFGRGAPLIAVAQLQVSVRP